MTFFVITCHNLFNVWPTTTLHNPVWCRDIKSLDTPVVRHVESFFKKACISHRRVCNLLVERKETSLLKLSCFLP